MLLAEVAAGRWDGMRVMQHFMGGFFLVFSFFKFLDLNEAAEKQEKLSPTPSEEATQFRPSEKKSLESDVLFS